MSSELRVEVAGRPCALWREATNDLGGVLHAVSLVARVDALGGERDVDVLAELQGRAQDQGGKDLFSGPRVAGGLQDHQRLRLDVFADGASRIFDRAKISSVVPG